MNKILPPAMIAGAIAGSSLGGAYGFMSTGEKLEDQGAGFLQQTGGSLGGGLKSGLIGAGVGLGATGTATALKHILGK